MKKLFVFGLAVIAAGIVAMNSPMASEDEDNSVWRGMRGGNCLMFGMMGRGRMMGHGMMGQGHMMRGQHMAGLVEERLATLKKKLNITESQQVPWDAYSDAVTTRVETMQGVHQSMMTAMQDGNALDRMEMRIANMEAMLETMKAVKPATEALYAVLTDNQKKTADELIGLGCGGM